MKCIKKIINIAIIILSILLALIAITELIFTFSFVAGFFGFIFLCMMCSGATYDMNNEYDVRNPYSPYYDPYA